MKKFFYIGLAGIALFEIFNVYFIMPMPGSQRMNSLSVAYFLYSYRWIFRFVFGIMVVAGAAKSFQVSRKWKWIPVLAVLIAGGVAYLFNFKMVADQMFKQPEHLVFKPKVENMLGDSAIVVGLENNGEVKAYPIQFIAYHHQVRDSVGGKPVMVTYCNVCRTGRVFEPTVKGQPEKFRLVGMDHFNAMFEDRTTKSWWRQANGEAVTGPLKGEKLPEVQSFQLSIGKLFELYPNARVMQLDETSKDNYDSLARFERGKSKGQLTRTDSLPWKEKSWVVGIQVGGASKAYDWITLKEQGVINDKVGGTQVLIAVSDDKRSFAAFERPADSVIFTVRHDTIFSGTKSYDFSGRDLSTGSQGLKKMKAYQEFWHSWRTFHPNTETSQQ